MTRHCDTDVAPRSTPPGSLIGQHGNPRPSDGARWEVEVIDQAEGEVCVRYVKSHDVDPWWITEEAWFAWKHYEEKHRG